ncbi:hypothetical protein Gpo141_00007678 [Globisporangium polare]
MHRPIPRASSPLTMIAPVKTEMEPLDTDDEMLAALRCAYRSKPCTNLRATKVNGDLHKLCDHHRQRANINQQRVHLRRRLEKKHARQLQQRQAREHERSVHSPDSPMAVEEGEDDVKRDSQCSELSMHDLVMLELILSYEPPSGRAGETNGGRGAMAAASNNSNVERLSFIEQLQFVV